MRQEYINKHHERAMKAPIVKVRQEYKDHLKTHEPTPVGLSRTGKYGRWHIVYNNGTSKKISWLWNIVPERYITKLVLDKPSHL